MQLPSACIRTVYCSVNAMRLYLAKVSVKSSGCCRALLGAHAALRGAALLALARLMCTSAQFCDDNLRLLVTLLHTRCACQSALSVSMYVCLCAVGSAHRNLIYQL